MKKQSAAISIALVVVICLATSVLSETKEINEDLQSYEGSILKLNEAWKPAKEITSLTDTKDLIKTTGTNQQNSDFIEWTEDTAKTQTGYLHFLSLALSLFDLDSIEFWFGEIHRDATERLVEIDQFDVSPAMQPAKNEFKLMLQDLKQGAYYGERGAKNLDADDIDTGSAYIKSATEHLENFQNLIPEDTEEIPTFTSVYRVSPCDAIDISIENTTVTDFLNATNMTTVQVYNFKDYKGENTWMVQWSSLNRSLDVYVNVATGNIVGIEEQTDVGPTPTPTWTLTTFIVEGDESSPIPETTITARFENGTISGTAGCNRYFGSYTVVNEITIGENLGMTKMYCSEPIMDQESQYTNILLNVTTYTIEENQLTLSTGDGRALVYTPTPTALPTLTPTDSSQGGTIWTLTTFIIDGNESSPILAEKPITVSFDNGTISGNAGCNGYFGSYTVVNKITIGGEDKLLGMSMMYCPEPIMDQEAQYTDILINVTNYTIEENQLTFSTEDNRTLVYQVEVEE